MTLRVVDWSSYQSYKDRKPPWIRLHKTLLDNFEFQSMSVNARALLPMIWLLVSEDEDPVSGLLRDSYEKVAFRLRMTVQDVTSGIAECIAAGFVEEINEQKHQVTESLRISYETVTPETETETETERYSYSSAHAKKIPSLEELENHPLGDHYRGWFEENCPSVQLEELRKELVLYCRSKGKRYRDYWATLQTWGMRKQKEKPHGISRKTTGQRADDALGQALAILEERPTC